MPSIEKPAPLHGEARKEIPEKNKAVYDKLAKISGFDKKTIQDVKRIDSRAGEATLKGIVDRKYYSAHSGGEKSEYRKLRESMVDNFHWIIMRARRSKKLSQEQLAREISETETAIKMAEQGLLPEDNFRLAQKLENFLGIKIRKDSTPIVGERPPLRRIAFDENTAREIRLDDLRKAKEEKREVTVKEKRSFGDDVPEFMSEDEMEMGDVDEDIDLREEGKKSNSRFDWD